MKKLTLILSLILLFVCLGVFAQAKTPDPLLVLEAEGAVLGGPATVWGQKVGNIGLNGGESEGTVTFDNLTLPQDGIYTLRIHYLSGSDDRTFDIYTDKGSLTLACPNTGSFDIVGTILVDIELSRGGYIMFGSDWYGPDLDKIEIFREGALTFTEKNYQNADNERFENQNGLILDKRNGVFSLTYGENTILANAHSEAKVNGEIICSDEFKSHTVTKENEKILFTHENHPDFGGKMIQSFRFTDGYVLTDVTITHSESITTNYICPMVIYPNSLHIENGLFLQMPYDNDAWVEPKWIAEEELAHTTNGYEVGAYINQKTGAGLVLGAVEHDNWKNGIEINGEDGKCMGLAVYSGIADGGTRDKDVHGSLSGKSVRSALTFLGHFDDWKDGMLAFADANVAVAPAKPSIDTVPFGFNSWGSLQSAVNYSTMIAISEYVHEYLQPVWGSEGETVYINIDSFWDYLSENDYSVNLTLDEALRAFALYCKENNQQAGIYFTPFAVWLDSETALQNTRMEGSSYSFYDAALRSQDGRLYGMLDSGWALDATHPATLARIEDQINYFIDLGFTYLKLDFLTHGALEGAHYNQDITTGTQAYNLAMAKIHELCNGKMFVNLSISPIFPYQYADGRRISCDAFASIENTQHVLSYLTAGFWQKTLYAYPDPDHLVVWGSSDGEARARVTGGVIAGTSFLVGDNLSDIKEGSEKHNFILSMFANPRVISVAKLGAAFKPVLNEESTRCADIYYHVTEDSLYIALFNFDWYQKEFTLDLSAFADVRSPNALELWRGEIFDLQDGKLTYTLSGEDAAIIAIPFSEEGVPPIEEPDPIAPVDPADPADPSVPAEDADKTPTENPPKQDGASDYVLWIVLGIVLLVGCAVGFIVTCKIRRNCQCKNK